MDLFKLYDNDGKEIGVPALGVIYGNKFYDLSVMITLTMRT